MMHRSAKRRRGWQYCIAVLFAVLLPPEGGTAKTKNDELELTDERFKDFEIRVIRPRYFAKSGRLEVGAQLGLVTNQTFLYGFLGMATATYHLTDAWAFEALYGVGTSIEKEDKDALADQFNIRTQIPRTASLANGHILWTPIYGKFQMFSGKLLYFETFFGAGGGLTGIEYQFDHCADVPGVRSTYVKQYSGVSFGMGQRFFLGKHNSLKWDLRNHTIALDARDGLCVDNPETEAGVTGHVNLMAQIGYTHFF